jgi:hypothetical protein
LQHSEKDLQSIIYRIMIKSTVMQAQMIKKAALAAAAGILYAFTQLQVGSVSGMVAPATAVESVMALRGSDTFRINAVNGQFSVNFSAGDYRICLEMAQSHKIIEYGNIRVEHNKIIELGVIHP